MAYSHLLALHGALRWLVLAAGIIALVVAVAGWSGAKPADGRLRRWSLLFVITMDLQLLVGLILYFLVSPLVRMAFQNMAVAMKDHELRFFTVEHTTYMLIAVVITHLGAAVSRKAKTDRAKYRGAAVCYGISLLLVLAGIPWWRPLLRLGG